MSDTVLTAAEPGLSSSPVPVIDVSGFMHGSPDERQQVVDAVGAACESIGFLVITGHDVDPALIETMYRTTFDFFALPMEEKMEIAGPEGDIYVAYSPKDGRYGASPDGPNLREVFHSSRFDTVAEAVANGYSPDVARSMPENQWPRNPVDYETTWKAYFVAMEELADRMLHIFAVALGLPEDWFDGAGTHHLGTMAANCYPEQPIPPEPGQLRNTAHVDFSTLTILYQDDAPGGLQVHQRGAGWRDVPCVPGSYVINLGDIMGRWTNDKWVATPHRVVNPPPERAMTRRLSLPFFHLPNHDAVIEAIPTCVTDESPLRWEPVVAGEWIEARRAGRPASAGRIGRGDSVTNLTAGYS